MKQVSRHNVDIEDINKRNSENIYKLVSRGEEAYHEQIVDIANNILKKNKKIVLIAGPSSSGKTTSSYKIQEQLSNCGVKSIVFNMDSFFRDLDTVPLREDGEPDMEGIVALDVECVRKCLNDILTTGKTMVPEFDFKTHKRKPDWHEMKVEGGEILIMEGIHALNPVITEGQKSSKIYKVYVHCNTDFLYENNILMEARDLRLLRRLVRDERTRHTPIEETLTLWSEVCKGEEKNIRPFKSQANFFLNSTHFYEPLLYKSLLLKKFEKYEDNKKVQAFLKKFKLFAMLDKNFIPRDSLVREFIGD